MEGQFLCLSVSSDKDRSYTPQVGQRLVVAEHDSPLRLIEVLKLL